MKEQHTKEYYQKKLKEYRKEFKRIKAEFKRLKEIKDRIHKS